MVITLHHAESNVSNLVLGFHDFCVLPGIIFVDFRLLIQLFEQLCEVFPQHRFKDLGLVVVGVFVRQVLDLDCEVTHFNGGLFKRFDVFLLSEAHYEDPDYDYKDNKAVYTDNEESEVAFRKLYIGERHNNLA